MSSNIRRSVTCEEVNFRGDVYSEQWGSQNCNQIHEKEKLGQPPPIPAHTGVFTLGARGSQTAVIPQNACTKFQPLGVPRPVAGSQPGPLGSVESRPKLRTNQRVENGLL